MKIKNILKSGLLVCIAVVTLTSCNDFLTIYPTDKTTGKDFWKKKEDVENMVTGAYQNMLAYGIQERAIVWGAFRSDELTKYSSYSSTSLDNISAVNLLPTNGYNGWGDFYSVINRCNLVLKHAPAVMDIDPQFTEGDYQVVRAQMLALRSLCYFYLVRAFRDVPYTTEAYETDDQEMKIAQSTPDSVLQHCIDDLKEAEPYVMQSGAYGLRDWRNQGYITTNAVDAILADIYLWRASMTHSKSDYQECVNYADKVIKAMDTYYQNNYASQITTGDNDIYHLQSYKNYFYNNFVSGNSRESILEWQYDGTNNSNTGLENYYYESGTSKSHVTTSILMASQLFNAVDANADKSNGTKIYLTKDDYRFWNNAYEVNNEEATQLAVRKFVTHTANVILTTSNVGEIKSNSRAFDNYQQNWIVYRLPDVMLMKAEAQVQLASGDDDASTLRSAFNIVREVNDRALVENSKDTLKFDDYKTVDGMERLVLAERERELCFEGKRWFDLVRYCYRHMTGVDIDKLMADQTEWPTLSSSMLKLVARKYTSGGDAFSYKMKSEPYLYFPISQSQIKVNTLLKQNPVFNAEESTSKN